MADITEKHGFGAIDLGQPFRPLAFFLIGKRVSNSSKDVVGSQFKKCAILIIKSAPRANPEDENPVRVLLPGTQQGKKQRCVSRLLIGSAGQGSKPLRQIVKN